MPGLDEGRRGTATLEVEAAGRVLHRTAWDVDLHPAGLRTWSGGGGVRGALLAGFVHPNHPVIASIVREAADVLAQRRQNPAFQAYQEDRPRQPARADEIASAIYEAVLRRRIVYSEPPPGWDLRTTGQRIRDHRLVANAGTGTCLDTTVLYAPSLEQAGLHPVVYLLAGHCPDGVLARPAHDGRAGDRSGGAGGECHRQR